MSLSQSLQRLQQMLLEGHREYAMGLRCDQEIESGEVRESEVQTR